MGVPEAEFNRVRGLVEKALAEAFVDHVVPPAELRPGYWELWPIRDIRIGIEETKIWHYGVPVGGTGKLQIHIEYPYGNHAREKPRGEHISERLVKSAVNLALMLSDQRAEHLRIRSVEAQEAYLFGYEKFWEMDAERQRRFFELFEEAKTSKGWSQLHEAIKRLFLKSRMDDPVIWDHLFEGEPQQESPRDWSPRDPQGYNPSRFDLFNWGVMDALDDWSQRRRFYN